MTVENDQIVPQSRAYAARPATSPLAARRSRTGGPRARIRGRSEYQINGQTYRINYTTDGVGHFVYEFVDPNGAKRRRTTRGGGDEQRLGRELSWRGDGA